MFLKPFGLKYKTIDKREIFWALVCICVLAVSTEEALNHIMFTTSSQKFIIESNLIIIYKIFSRLRQVIVKPTRCSLKSIPIVMTSVKGNYCLYNRILKWSKHDNFLYSKKTRMFLKSSSYNTEPPRFYIGEPSNSSITSLLQKFLL